MALPDFFLIGAPKAGTTALHVALARHSQLYLSRVKEPKYFLTEGPPPTGGGPGDAKTFREYVWQRDAYERLFDDAPPGSLRGESTSLYLHDEQAARRIRDAVPAARLIALLRDPVDRAHPNWAHLWSAGLETEADFVKACLLEDERRALGWASFWSYLDLGRYGGQLERLFSVFPRDQVLLLRYRDLREDPIGTLDRVCAFLGVGTGVLDDVPAENVTAHATDSALVRASGAVLRAAHEVQHRVPAAWWPKIDKFLTSHIQREQRPRQPLTASQREALIPLVADDVLLLERITDESFDEWLDPQWPGRRSPLKPVGRIGTAHNSIDRPIRDRHDHRSV
jgi:hypothetical protein